MLFEKYLSCPLNKIIIICSIFFVLKRIGTFYLASMNWVLEHWIQEFSLLSQSRSSHRRCSIKKVVLKDLAKFTGKHLYQRFSFNKVAVLRTAKKRLWHRCFSVNLGQFLRTPFLQNTSGRLLRPVCKIVWIKPCLSDQWVLHICLCGVYSCSKYH